MKFLVLIGVWLMCIEFFHVEGIGSNGITLKVIQHQTTPKDIVEGNSITLFCDDSSMQPARHTAFDASFFRNDIQIHNLQKPYTYVFGRYLTIQKMNKEDSGSYKCTFNTTEGEKLTSGPYVLKVGDLKNSSVQATEPMMLPGTPLLMIDVSNTRKKRSADIINTLLTLPVALLNASGINVG